MTTASHRADDGDRRERGVNQIIEDALSNEEFMEQTRASLAAIERGERGTPLREILAAERSARPQND